MQLRARSKPRGYAGDFETLLLFNERYQCNHPLGKFFDRYFQRQAAVEAVRARTAQIAGWIAEHALSNPADPFRIVSIGCGPALDIQLAIRLLPDGDRRRLQIQLFDLDEAAVQHAESKIAPLLAAGQMTIHRENLYRLGQLPSHGNLLHPANFIFCTGLFDYLDDEPAVALVTFLWGQLRPSGKLVIGNFSPTNPTRSYMEWIGNWYLLYRTPAQLAALANAAGLSPAQRSIVADRTGVQLLLVAEKS
jgi:hypothetical protein